MPIQTGVIRRDYSGTSCYREILKAGDSCTSEGLLRLLYVFNALTEVDKEDEISYQ